MKHINLSKTILEMGNRQIQVFLRGMTGTELSKIIYYLNENAQDKIYRNMSVRAVTHLQMLVEKLISNDDIPQINDDVIQSLMKSKENTSPIEISQLESNYSMETLIGFLGDLNLYIQDNGFKDFDVILENIASPQIKQMIVCLKEYDNVIDFETVLDILLTRRMEEIKLENKLLKHGLMKVFQEDTNHLTYELMNMIPFADLSNFKKIEVTKILLDAETRTE